MAAFSPRWCGRRQLLDERRRRRRRDGRRDAPVAVSLQTPRTRPPYRLMASNCFGDDHFGCPPSPPTSFSFFFFFFFFFFFSFFFFFGRSSLRVVVSSTPTSSNRRHRRDVTEFLHTHTHTLRYRDAKFLWCSFFVVSFCFATTVFVSVTFSRKLRPGGWAYGDGGGGCGGRRAVGRLRCGVLRRGPKP